MKKLIFSLFSVIAFVGCSHDMPYDSGNYQQIKKETFVSDFNNTFGVTSDVYKNHQWGMDIVPLIDITDNVTRGVNANGNQWEGQGYTIPSDITKDELDAVLKVFNKKGEKKYTSLVDWDEYFVQQVYKGNATYKNHDNQTVTGSEHMDWLCTVTNKHVNVVSWWPYEEEIVIGDNYDDHINNFNNGKATASWTSEASGKTIKELMLMVNTNSNVFGFKSSEDNGHVFYNFRMEYIAPYGYFVGFDFEAAGNNPNEQVDRDYIYNDWIVKIVPGKGVTPPEPNVESVRIMCEDLGASSSDFDYNDVVFDIIFVKNGSTYTANITLQAAGGTLPLTIGGQEVHNLFAEANHDETIGTTTMINTHATMGTHVDGLAPVEFTVTLPSGNYTNAWDAINALPVYVLNPNGQVIQLTVNPGTPAEMIAVPNTTAWPNERASIKNKYPAFATWISDSSIKWWE